MIKKTPFVKEIKTDRLVLKTHELSFDYAQKLYEIIIKNHIFLTKYLDKLSYVKTPEDEYKYLLTLLQSIKEMEKVDYGIWLKNELIGTIGTHGVDYETESADIGYWLSQEHNGKGYMTEAVKALEDDLFERNFNRLTIIIDTQNIPSQNVAIRRGFTKEGIMRQWHYNQTLQSYRDMYLYSKLKQEWKK